MSVQVVESKKLTVTERAYEASKIPLNMKPEEVPPDDAITLYIEAVKLRDDLDSKLKEIGRLTSTLEPSIIEYFKEKGQQRVTRGGRTVYLARELWPAVGMNDLIDAAGGLGNVDDATLATIQETARARLIEALATDPETKHLVKAAYNHQTLRSFILADCPEGDDGLPIIPEHLKGKLGVTEVFKAKVLKGS